MNLDRLLHHLDQGLPLEAGTDAYACMSAYSQEALRLTARLNGSYHSPEKIVRLMTELTGKPVDAFFRMFPPFFTDFGKNISLGKNVFINACCCFQDQGGITLGNGVFIGHGVVVATVNHGLRPADRKTLYPARVTVGDNVWIGAGARILPGVTIGANAVIAAGAVVSKDVEPDTIAAGVPARFHKTVHQAATEPEKVLMPL